MLTKKFVEWFVMIYSVELSLECTNDSSNRSEILVKKEGFATHTGP